MERRPFKVAITEMLCHARMSWDIVTGNQHLYEPVRHFKNCGTEHREFWADKDDEKDF